MNVIILSNQKERHANNFTDGEVVFLAEKDGKKVEIRCLKWSKAHSTFELYFNGLKVTNCTNFPKAIGMVVMELYK